MQKLRQKISCYSPFKFSESAKMKAEISLTLYIMAESAPVSCPGHPVLAVLY
jgi:hypothetical protein